MKIQILFSLVLLATSTACAQYEVDPTFGNGGDPYLWSSMGGVDYYKESIRTSEDKIFFTGWTFNPGSTRAIIGSCTAEGEMNSVWGPSWNQSFLLPGSESSNGYQISLQSDDKLIMGGVTIMEDANVSSLFVSRVTPMGLIDATFGNEGSYIYAPADSDLFMGDMLVTPSDEVFILGRYRAPQFGAYSLLIIKLTADGQPDPSFGEDGMLIFNTGNTNRYLSSGLFLENGQLLVGGSSDGIKFILINSDGTIDNSFGGNGSVSTSGLSELHAIEKFGDWYYALSSGNGFESFIYKFNELGMDETYGENGEVDLDQAGFINDAFFTEQGKVYFTGFSQGISNLTRADTSGVLDTTFFAGGFSSFETFENNAAFYSCLQLSDGDLIVSGQGIDLLDSGSGQDFMAYKLTADGVVDDISELKVMQTIVFPNPFQTKFQVKSDEKIYQVELRNISGKSILSEDANSNEFTLETGSLESGVYFVSLFSESGISTRKIIRE